MGWAGLPQYDAWEARKKITIDATNIDATLTDIPVRVKITDDSDVLDLAKSDGSDIFFTDAVGNKIPHTIVKYNQILIRNTIQSWFNNPSIVHYKDVKDCTYFCFIDSSDDHAYIGCWNHDSSSLSKTDLGIIEHDDHNNPTIQILPSGKIVVFLFFHKIVNDDIAYYVKSTNSEDISSFSARVDLALDSEYNYIQPSILAGESDRVYITWRGTREIPLQHRNRMISWSDNLDTVSPTWETAKELIENIGQRPYIHQISEETDKIHFVVNSGNPSSPETPNANLYHFYKQGDNYYKSDGTLIGDETALPLALSDMTLIYSGATFPAWSWDIAQKDGKIAIIFSQWRSHEDMRLRYAYLSGGVWTENEIAETGTNILFRPAEPIYLGGATIDQDDLSIVYVIKTDANKDKQLYKAITTDNGLSWTLTALTTNGGKKLRPLHSRNAHADFKLMMLEGHFSDWSGGYKCNLMVYPTLGTLLESEFIVKIPSISSSVDTDIFVYYGYPDASIQEDEANTEDSNTILAKYSDKTYETLGSLDLSSLTAFTIESAGEILELDIPRQAFLSNFISTGNAYFVLRKSVTLHELQTFFETLGGQANIIFTDLIFAQDVYSNFAIRYNGSLINGYKDGVKSSISLAETNAMHGTISPEPLTSGINPQSGINQDLNGYVDFVRISNVARTDAWIKAMGISLKDQASFLTFASEETIVPVRGRTGIIKEHIGLRGN